MSGNSPCALMAIYIRLYFFTSIYKLSPLLPFVQLITTRPIPIGAKSKGGYTLVTLPRTVTPYRDSVDGAHDHVTYQKLVTR
jgi:hypothetical protein